MRICIVSEREYGCGASIAAHRLAKAMADSGHEVYYIFYYSHPCIKSQGVFKLLLNDKPHLLKRIVEKIIRKNSFRYRQSYTHEKLCKVLSTIGPDVVNLHNVGAILSHDDIVLLGFRYPIIWTMHDLFAIKPYSYRFVNRSGKVAQTVPIRVGLFDYEARNRMLASSTNLRFVAPSKWLRDSVLEDANGRKEIHVIRNGLEKREFFPENRLKARVHFGLTADKFYLLFVASRIEYERKNISVLLEAVSRLHGIPIEVIAVGGAGNTFKKKYPFLRCFAPTFELSEIRRLYSAADVFVITSLADNLPNTVSESMFCGTPVLGANVGGIPEMIVPEQTGWLFNPLDPDELADVLSRVYKQKEALLGMEQNCVYWAQKDFNIEKQRDEYAQLFKRAMVSRTLGRK